MVYAAGICGSLEQMQDLNIIRPALFAGPAPLLEPGVGAEGVSEPSNIVDLCKTIYCLALQPMIRVWYVQQSEPVQNGEALEGLQG